MCRGLISTFVTKFVNALTRAVTKPMARRISCSAPALGVLLASPASGRHFEPTIPLPHRLMPWNGASHLSCRDGPALLRLHVGAPGLGSELDPAAVCQDCRLSEGVARRNPQRPIRKCPTPAILTLCLAVSPTAWHPPVQESAGYRDANPAGESGEVIAGIPVPRDAGFVPRFEPD
jgi:hypothetical protein